MTTMRVALVKDGKTQNVAVLDEGAPVPEAWRERYDEVVALVPGSEEERLYTTPPMWAPPAEPEIEEEQP